MTDAPAPRLPLRETVSRDDIDDATAACGWQLVNILPPQEGQPGQLIYATAGGAQLAYLVEDRQLGLYYFTAVGEGAQEAIDELGARLAGYDAAEVERMLASAEAPTMLRGLSVVALQQREPSDSTLAAFRRALEHEEPSVAGGALVAAAYGGWPQLVPMLRAFAAREPGAALAASAEQILARMGA